MLRIKWHLVLNFFVWMLAYYRCDYFKPLFSHISPSFCALSDWTVSTCNRPYVWRIHSCTDTLLCGRIPPCGKFYRDINICLILQTSRIIGVFVYNQLQSVSKFIVPCMADVAQCKNVTLQCKGAALKRCWHSLVAGTLSPALVQNISVFEEKITQLTLVCNKETSLKSCIFKQKH